MLCRLSRVQRPTTAAGRSFFALPHSFGAAAVASEQLVSGCSTVLARIRAPASSRGFCDALTAERTRFLVVSHGTRLEAI